MEKKPDRFYEYVFDIQRIVLLEKENRLQAIKERKVIL